MVQAVEALALYDIALLDIFLFRYFSLTEKVGVWIAPELHSKKKKTTKFSWLSYMKAEPCQVSLLDLFICCRYVWEGTNIEMLWWLTEYTHSEM